MGLMKYCDGCGASWKVVEFALNPPSEPALEITRVNGLGGGGMPSGTAHLCSDCGKIAWDAIQAARTAVEEETTKLAPRSTDTCAANRPGGYALDYCTADKRCSSHTADRSDER